MRTNFTAAVLLAAGSLLAANAFAQQTPAATTSSGQSSSGQSSSSQSSTTKSSAATAKKSTATTTTTPPAFKSRKEKFSYALGMNIGTGLGQNLKQRSVEFDPALVAEGLKDTLANGKTRLTQEEAQAVLKEVQAEVMKEQQAKAKEASDKNKTDGEKFLAANKEKEGVVTLPSGLQYKIVKEGDGPKPAASDTVVCNYKGTLVDGKEFDSSYKRGQPATFPVSGVIKGWTEALQLMPVGSKWELYVPPDLGYGERGAGADIGPNSTLIFEVELVSIKPKEEGKAKDEKPGDKPGDEQKPQDQAPPPNQK